MASKPDKQTGGFYAALRALNYLQFCYTKSSISVLIKPCDKPKLESSVIPAVLSRHRQLTMGSGQSGFLFSSFQSGGFSHTQNSYFVISKPEAA
jgi:hypothetical protein